MRFLIWVLLEWGHIFRCVIPCFSYVHVWLGSGHSWGGRIGRFVKVGALVTLYIGCPPSEIEIGGVSTLWTRFSVVLVERAHWAFVIYFSNWALADCFIFWMDSLHRKL